MNDKLEIIKNSINEIRETLGAECMPIDELPGLVKDMTIGSGRGGFTTAFIFSADDNPNKPSGGKMDMTTGALSGVKDG
jgi:hypothetical protein